MKTKASRVYTAACLSVLTLAASSVTQAGQAETPAQPEKTYAGTIVTVDSQERTLEAKGVFFTKKFNLGDSCAYILPDHNAGTATDLRAGEKILVSYQDTKGVTVADRVEQLPMCFEGTVKELDPTNSMLTIHVSTLDKTFQIASDCKIVLRDEKSGTLADIRAGDHVTVTYEEPDGALAARQIAQTSMVFTGSLVAIDLSERTVKAKEGFSTKKFNLADNCAIVVNGKTDGRLDELKPNDRLVFNYDEINGVNVVTRIAPTMESTNSVVSLAPSTAY